MHGTFLIPDFLPPIAPPCGAYGAVMVNGYCINEHGVCLNPAPAYKFSGRRAYLKLEIAYYGPGRFSIGGSYGVKGNATGCGGCTWPASSTGDRPKPVIADSIRFYFERAISSIRKGMANIESGAIREEAGKDLLLLEEDLKEIFIAPKQLLLF